MEAFSSGGFRNEVFAVNDPEQEEPMFFGQPLPEVFQAFGDFPLFFPAQALSLPWIEKFCDGVVHNK